MILDGRKISKEVAKQVEKKIKKYKLKPCLAVILIGKDPGSLIYVRLKQNAAKKIGIDFKKFALRQNISQKKVLELINKLNKDKKVHGIIVQVPTPKQLHTPTLLKAVSTKKDVDAFKDESKFIPPIHQGVIKLIKTSKKPLKNKKVLILGKNPFFIKGLEPLLKKLALKPKTIYIKDKLPIKEMQKADVLITVLGKPHIIKPAMIKKNAVLIDVGYSRVSANGGSRARGGRDASGGKGKSCGDIDPLVKNKTSYLSPVPGGIGPLTVIYLLKNVYLAAKIFSNKQNMIK